MTFTGHHSGPGRTDSAGDRLIAALADPDYRFTPEQAVFLMAAAARWAREPDADVLEAGRMAGLTEATELNLDAISLAVRAPAFSEAGLRHEGYRRTARREWDTAAAWPWRGDYTGGALADWLDETTERPDLPVSKPSVRVRAVGGQLVWADAS